MHDEVQWKGTEPQKTCSQLQKNNPRAKNLCETCGVNREKEMEVELLQHNKRVVSNWKRSLHVVLVVNSGL